MKARTFRAMVALGVLMALIFSAAVFFANVVGDLTTAQETVTVENL